MDVLSSTFDALIDLLLRATVLLLASGLLAALLIRASAASRHVVLVAGLFAVLALPATRALLPRIDVPAVVAVGPMSQLTKDEAVANGLGPADGASQMPSRPVRVGSTFAVMGTTVWLIGVLAVAIRWFRASRLVRASLDVNVGLADERVVDRATTIARDLGLHRDPVLRLDAGARGPLVWGVRRPVLLLPQEALQWSDAMLDAVLVHELTHFVRRDHLSLWVTRLATCLAWCHPLVWLVASRARLEQERACDDAVLARGTRPSDYAEQLLQLARRRRRDNAMFGAPAMARSSDLEARVTAILDSRRSRRPCSSFSFAMSLALLAVSIPISASQPSTSIAVLPSAPDPMPRALTRLLPPRPLPSGPLQAQAAPAARVPPDLSGTWLPEVPETAWRLFEVGVIDLPGDGMTITRQGPSIHIVRPPSTGVDAWHAITGLPVDSVITPDGSGHRINDRWQIHAGWSAGRLVVAQWTSDLSFWTYYSLQGNRLRVEWVGRNGAVVYFRRAGGTDVP